MTVSLHLHDCQRKDKLRSEIEEATRRFLAAKRKIRTVPTPCRNGFKFRDFTLPGSPSKTNKYKRTPPWERRAEMVELVRASGISRRSINLRLGWADSSVSHYLSGDANPPAERATELERTIEAMVAELREAKP